jgi:hypothetical protein
MCNLYSMISTQEAMRRLAQAFNDGSGSLPPLPASTPTVWRRS